MNITRITSSLLLRQNELLLSRQIPQCINNSSNNNLIILTQGISTSSCFNRARTGRFRVTLKHDKPLTYEQFNKPHHIAHRKAWNSYNTENLNFAEFGIRSSATTLDDEFIRKFMTGTWHNLFVSEIIIKRQHNLIRIAGIIQRTITSRKIYFLIGYTEELLSYWLQCPIKLELQTVDDKKDVVFKYV